MTDFQFSIFKCRNSAYTIGYFHYCSCRKYELSTNSKAFCVGSIVSLLLTMLPGSKSYTVGKPVCFLLYGDTFISKILLQVEQQSLIYDLHP